MGSKLVAARGEGGREWVTSQKVNMKDVFENNGVLEAQL